MLSLSLLLSEITTLEQRSTCVEETCTTWMASWAWEHGTEVIIIYQRQHHGSYKMHMTWHSSGEGCVDSIRRLPFGRTNMYVLALIHAFIMFVLMELISHTWLIMSSSNPVGAVWFRHNLHLFRGGLVRTWQPHVMSI